MTGMQTEQPVVVRPPSPDLEQYYREAGPDYAAWSPAFNMHFGYWRWGMNPLQREPMLEQMNAEVSARLHLEPQQSARVLDMGCGVGATLRSFARRLPLAELTGITLVPWQVERGTQLNAEAGGRATEIKLLRADYEDSNLETGSYDAAYALESSCYAHRADKALLLAEAHRLLRPGGRLVVADGFLRGAGSLNAMTRPIYQRLCKCWVIETLAELEPFVGTMRQLGFCDIVVEHLQYRVAPSVLHIPWVTAKFLLGEVVLGEGKMTQARWNNVIAPALLPLVGYPGGPMVYYMVSATRG
jgi:SAM-dependent methyltransferase